MKSMKSMINEINELLKEAYEKLWVIDTTERQLFSVLRLALFSDKYKTQAIQNLSIKRFFELFKADTLRNKILKYFITTE